MLWDSYNSVRAELALYFGQDLVQCGKLTDTRIRKLFESKPFANWKAGRENENKAVHAVLNRLDAIIQSTGNVAQILARRG
jgi:hypothetical protein